MRDRKISEMICGNCRYYTEGTIYLDGSMEHLYSSPASPFLDDPVVPDGGCYEFKEADHGQD